MFLTDVITFQLAGIIVDRGVKVMSLANGEKIKSIETQGNLKYPDFSNGSLYAFEETTENNTDHSYLHCSGSEEKKCKVTTTATKLRRVHRECLIAIDNGDQGTGVSMISMNSFNNNGEVATETQKPTAPEDEDFKVQELVLLSSVALARFQNKVEANFWMVLDFKPG